MTGSQDRRDRDTEGATGVPPHRPPADERDDGVDEASEESFPSSDPPASGTPSVGARART